jgi:hypothetical protein
MKSPGNGESIWTYYEAMGRQELNSWAGGVVTRARFDEESSTGLRGLLARSIQRKNAAVKRRYHRCGTTIP